MVHIISTNDDTMSPMQIKIMLHYYYSFFDFKDMTSKASKEFHSYFVREGMLKKHDITNLIELPEGTYESSYEITDKGKAYVELLKRVKPPKVAWVSEPLIECFIWE